MAGKKASKKPKKAPVSKETKKAEKNNTADACGLRSA